MSSWSDGYSGAKFGDELQAWHDALRIEHPCLADALLGNEETRKDGEPFRPPFTLMICRKGGALRMMLSSPDSPKTWFGPEVNPHDVLASVEAALAGNKGEWSMKNGKSPSKPRF